MSLDICSQDESGKPESSKEESANAVPMSFKDWKMHKEVIDNRDEAPQKRKSDKNKKTSKGRGTSSTPPSLFSNNFNQNPLPTSFMGGWKSFSNVHPAMYLNDPNLNRGGGQSYGFSGMNFNGRNGGMNLNGQNGGMNFNGQNGGMNFNGRNGGMNFNCQNGGMNFNGQNGGMKFNSRNSSVNYNGQNGGMNFNGRKGGSNFNNGSSSGGFRYNQNNTDNFFNTDGFFPQRDMIEETIADNPIRNKDSAQQLTDEFKNKKYQNTTERKKPAANKSRPVVRKENEKNVTGTPMTPTKSEPKIFIKNPRKESNKPYIPMPKPPEDEITGTLEERKQQWKDYRDAMKPFKNREFYNAKRVVQRLGKKDPSELDEKDQFRLANAQEKMAQYKQKLSEKYDHYIQSPDKPPTGGTGELFVLKRGTQSQWSSTNKPNPEQYKNYGNFGESHSSSTTNSFSYGFSSSSGRKILGGTSKYPSFVSGGTFASGQTTQY